MGKEKLIIFEEEMDRFLECIEDSRYKIVKIKDIRGIFIITIKSQFSLRNFFLNIKHLVYKVEIKHNYP